MKLELPLLMLSSAVATVQGQAARWSLWCTNPGTGCSWLTSPSVYPTYDCGYKKWNYYHSGYQKWFVQPWEIYKDTGEYLRCCRASGKVGCEMFGFPVDDELGEEGVAPEGEEHGEQGLDDAEEAEGKVEGKEES